MSAAVLPPNTQIYERIITLQGECLIVLSREKDGTLVYTVSGTNCLAFVTDGLPPKVKVRKRP